MSWSHRVSRKTDKHGSWFEMREYYYGTSEAFWTEDAITPGGEYIEELIWELRMMLRAAKRAKRNPSLILDVEEEA